MAGYERFLGWLLRAKPEPKSHPVQPEVVETAPYAPRLEGLSQNMRRSTKRFGEFNATLPHQPRPTDQRRQFKRDAAYENSAGIKEALGAIDAGISTVLVTGRAGTGKTTLIRYLAERAGGEKQAVVAPTAIAALSANAQTIHSFFHLPHQVLDARDLPPGKNFGTLYRHLTRLVIDEISMVRVDLLDAIDARLREIRGDSRPFGGVQLLMIGDFLQLPPVVKREDRVLLHGLGYKTPYAFSAKVLDRVSFASVSLDDVHRQHEEDFIEVLGKVRSGEDEPAALAFLNSRCFRPHRATANPLLLTPTRVAADGYNRSGLATLPGPSSFFRAQISGKLDISKDRLPVPENLELRVGARVMAAKNDVSRRWINGSLGTVTRFSEEKVFVRFDYTDEEYPVERTSWEKIRQIWNGPMQRIDTEVVGSYRQFPLVPAWAITIHKAQGLSLDDLRIDLGSGAFAPGQLYVALSRARTLAGLSLARPLRATDIVADPILVPAFAGV